MVLRLPRATITLVHETIRIVNTCHSPSNIAGTESSFDKTKLVRLVVALKFQTSICLKDGDILYTTG